MQLLQVLISATWRYAFCTSFSFWFLNVLHFIWPETANAPVYGWWTNIICLCRKSPRPKLRKYFICCCCCLSVRNRELLQIGDVVEMAKCMCKLNVKLYGLTKVIKCWASMKTNAWIRMRLGNWWIGGGRRHNEIFEIPNCNKIPNLKTFFWYFKTRNVWCFFGVRRVTQDTCSTHLSWAFHSWIFWVYPI